MPYRINNDYYVPRSKGDLIKAILPSWKGSRTELREMSRARLIAIFHKFRQEALIKLCKKT